jgi:hypothetical protein
MNPWQGLRLNNRKSRPNQLNRLQYAADQPVADDRRGGRVVEGAGLEFQ